MKGKEYTRKLGKWGNSVAHCWPKPVLDELGLRQSDWVVMYVEDGKVVVKPRQRPRRKELVAGITPENQHNEDLLAPAGQPGDRA